MGAREWSELSGEWRSRTQVPSLFQSQRSVPLSTKVATDCWSQYLGLVQHRPLYRHGLLTDTARRIASHRIASSPMHAKTGMQAVPNRHPVKRVVHTFPYPTNPQ
jgi:hypothetical protein